VKVSQKFFAQSRLSVQESLKTASKGAENSSLCPRNERYEIESLSSLSSHLQIIHLLQYRGS